VVGELSTTGDGKLRTHTFAFASLPVRASDSSAAFDVELRATDAAGDPQPLVVSMVRVVKVPLDSPPPPPLPPGVQFVTVHKTKVELTATGDVSDYTDDVKDGLANKFAELAGVDTKDVEVEVRTASVLIVVSITVTDAAAASALSTTVTTQLNSASAASSFTGLSITSAPTARAVATTTIVTQPPSSPVPLIVILPSAFGGGAVLLTCVLVGLYVHRRRKRPRKTDPMALTKV